MIGSREDFDKYEQATAKPKEPLKGIEAGFATFDAAKGEFVDSGKLFTTGAVRSGDAEAEHWELISPIAMREILEHGMFREFGEDCTHEILSDGLSATFDFLASSQRSGYLVEAAVYCLVAIDAQAKGGQLPKNYSVSYHLHTLPHAGLQAVARAAAEGAVKYAPYNWERGMPVVEMIRHALRHIYLWLAGDRKEDHLGHAAWNYFGAIHSLVKWPELNEGTLRTGDCDPPEK